MKLEEIYEPIRDELEKLEDSLSVIYEKAPPFLSEPLRYVLKGKGKRLRPAITLLSGKLSNFSPHLHLLAATAVELLHTATLVHDDIVDRSLLRRGKPAPARVWGEGPILLLGDYLFATSAKLISNTNDVGLMKLYARLLRVISQAELSYHLTPWRERISRKSYFRWIGGKTASLFSWAAKAGGRIGGMSFDKEASISRYGFFFGIAFQIIDDLLDFIGGEERRKPVGLDLANKIATLPMIIFAEKHPDKLPQSVEEMERLFSQIKEDDLVIKECKKEAERFGLKAIENLKIFPHSIEVESLIGLVEYTISQRW